MKFGFLKNWIQPAPINPNPQTPTENSQNQTAAPPVSNAQNIIGAPFEQQTEPKALGGRSSPVAVAHPSSNTAVQVAANQGVTPLVSTPEAQKNDLSASPILWNHLDSQQATELLKGMPSGTWLLRKSSDGNQYAISYVVDEKTIEHVRIGNDAEKLKEAKEKFGKNFVQEKNEIVLLKGMPVGTWLVRESTEPDMFNISFNDINLNLVSMKVAKSGQAVNQIRMKYGLRENIAVELQKKEAKAVQKPSIDATSLPNELDSQPLNYDFGKPDRIGSDGAKKLLQNKPELTWILRRSKEPGKAVVSYVKNNQVIDLLIDNTVRALEEVKEHLGRNLKDIEADKLRASSGKFLVKDPSYLATRIQLASPAPPATLDAHPAYLGSKTGDEAMKLLEGHPDKTWLLRYSDSRKSFYVSYKVGNAVTHEKISTPADLDKMIKDQGLGTNVQAFIRASAKAKLRRAGERFKHLFAGTSNGRLKPMVNIYHPEFMDVHNRYGRKLMFFFDAWKSSVSTDSFIDWMKKFDAGLTDQLGLKPEEFDKLKNSQYALLTQDNRPNIEKIVYLNEEQRKDYELKIENGLIKTDREGILNTPPSTADHPQAHVFVVSGKGKIYTAIYQRGTMNHSSFLAGAPVRSAGELIVENGKITAITDKSGHYETSREMLLEGVKALRRKGVDLSQVTVILNSHPLATDPKEKINALDFLAEGEKREAGNTPDVTIKER